MANASDDRSSSQLQVGRHSAVGLAKSSKKVARNPVRKNTDGRGAESPQIIGVGLGLVLSLILIYVINVQSFGWTLQFKPPWALLGWSSLAVPLATALAGWLFAARILRRALRPPTAAPLAS